MHECLNKHVLMNFNSNEPSSFFKYVSDLFVYSFWNYENQEDSI